MSWARFLLWCMASAVALIFAIAAGAVSYLYWIGAPSAEARENFRKLEEVGLGSEPFDLVSLRGGDWRFACVVGEYVVDPDHVAQPYASSRGYKAEPVDDFRGDIMRVTPWAIVMFDAAGKHFTWRMNERLLGYRTAEDQADGWCFEASEPLRLVAAPSVQLLDIAGRDAVLEELSDSQQAVQ